LQTTTRSAIRATAAAVLIFVATLSFVLTGAAGGASTSANSVYWGAWIGPQLTGTEAPWDMSAVSEMEERLGKSMSLVEFSAPFTNCESACKPQEFPRVGMNSIRNHGSIPVLSWGSQATDSGLEDPEYTLARIADGEFDSYLDRFAQQAKAWGHPFFLRFNWEMNGNWFLWGSQANGNTPADYVAAWRHVHDIFTSVGATNATWVWCPYANGSRNLNQLKALYPGDEYVDWTCLDGYNWGPQSVNPSPWRSFSFLFGPSYKRIVNKIAPSKPMMIGEVASNGGGKPKATWIHNMFAELPRRFPQIRAVIWFDRPDRGLSWTLESSPAASKAFAQAIKSDRYVGNSFAGLTADPIPPPG
jgi:mannan endo-1,4-beta-mannosidase